MKGVAPLIDPDCRDGKCVSCVGGPCEHHCHADSPAVAIPPGAAGDQTRCGEALDTAAVGSTQPQPAAAAPLLVVGLDLSIASTGIAHVYSHTAVVDRITSTPEPEAGYGARGARLRVMRAEIVEQVGKPQLVVVEAPSYNSTGKHAHDLIGLWWMVITVLQARGIPLAYMAPATRAKYLTGSGRAGKDEVLAAAVSRFPHVRVTRNDEADALALAAAGADWLGCPLVELPATHRAALKAVHWPDRERVVA